MVHYGKTKIPTITIPKGTLLFRSTLNQASDYEGVDNCIPPQYNVFFYYSPFVVDGIPEWYESIPNMHIYVASHDLEIVSLISPSKFTRMTRLKKKQFMIPCNKTRKSCLKPRVYDPCFRETFLEKHPEILGWTAIGKNDITAFKSSVKQGVLGDKVKYVHYVQDDRKLKGPPELAIYPLKERHMTDIQPPKDKSLFNYELIKTVSRSGNDLEMFMKNHAVQVPGKWYYTYRS
jgi:hypothetical protein